MEKEKIVYEKEAETFINFYVLCSYFYIGMRLIRNTVNECISENNKKILLNSLNYDFPIIPV